MKLIKSLLISAVSIYIADIILSGITVTGFEAAIIAAIVLALINVTIIPILKVITFPLNVITLGLVGTLLNGVAIKLTSKFVTGFEVRSFFSALIAAFVISFIQSILSKIFNDNKDHRR